MARLVEALPAGATRSSSVSAATCDRFTVPDRRGGPSGSPDHDPHPVQAAGTSWPVGRICSLPPMPTGTIGTPSFSAT